MPTITQRGATYAVIAALLIAPAEGLWLSVKPDRLANGLLTGGYGTTTYARPLKLGETHTQQEWMGILVADIPRYYAMIAPCIHVQTTEHFKAAMTSAAYNAGARAVCKSPMVARINAAPANVEHACDGLHNWYVHAGGKFVQGLVNRREKEYKVCITKDVP